MLFIITRERLLKLEKDTARIVERLSRIRRTEPTDAGTSIYTHRSLWQEQTRGNVGESSPLPPPSGPSLSPPSMDVSASPVAECNAFESPPHFHHNIGDI